MSNAQKERERFEEVVKEVQVIAFKMAGKKKYTTGDLIGLIGPSLLLQIEVIRALHGLRAELDALAYNYRLMREMYEKNRR